MNDNNIYIGYGIGCNYHSISEQVKEKVKLSFLCDKKWDVSVSVYDNIPVIQQSDILKLENPKVIIFPCDGPVKHAIAKELQGLGIDYIFADEVFGRRILSGKDIKVEGNDGVWQDSLHNKIYFHDSLPDEISIHLYGSNNMLSFEEGIVVDRLIICMGNNGTCEIGKNSRIGNGIIYVAYASVKIGRDCLISLGLTIRTHDAHPIFDRSTHKRINYAKDVILHNHVWIAEGVCLLPGAEIGEGSIVGAKTVTSSKFGDHVIVAGVPGKVIRENICWSKDSTECMNYACLEDCATDDALRYC